MKDDDFFIKVATELHDIIEGLCKTMGNPIKLRPLVLGPGVDSKHEAMDKILRDLHELNKTQRAHIKYTDELIDKLPK